MARDRIRPSDQLRALEERQEQLRQELASLSASKRALLLRNALLSCWCEALSYIQLVSVGQQPNDMASDAHGGRFEQLLGEEVQLLQQLSSTEGTLGPNPSLEQLLQPDSNTIAPCTNPMVNVMRCASQAPSDQTLCMDGPALAAEYQRTVQAASILLHQLNMAPPSQQQGLRQRLADTWQRYNQLLYDLIMHGKVDVVEAAVTTNLETMQYEPAAATKHQAAQAAAWVPALQLTEQQQELIPIGLGLYNDLVAVIHRERHELNSQMTAAVDAPSAHSAAAAAAADLTGSSLTFTSHHSRDPLQELPQRAARLQQQAALTDRLNLLLHKEYKLRLAAMGWFIGSLTYEQITRLAVASWPYGVRLLFVANEIKQWRALQA